MARRGQSAMGARWQQAAEQGWWRDYDPVTPGWLRVFLAMEHAATRITVYAPQLVPDLLQTDDYAAAALTTPAGSPAGDETDQRVQVRLGRQRILTGDAPVRLWAVIPEHVLRANVGGDAVMRAQRKYLSEVAQHRHIMLQVLPRQAGAVPAAPAPFVVLHLPSERLPVVYREDLGGVILVEDPVDAQDYEVAYSHLQAAALGPTESAELVAAISHEEG